MLLPVAVGGSWVVKLIGVLIKAVIYFSVWIIIVLVLFDLLWLVSPF